MRKFIFLMFILVVVCILLFRFTPFINDVQVEDLKVDIRESSSEKIVSCTVKNSGNKMYTYVIFEFVLLDENENNIGSVFSKIENMKPNEQKKVQELIDQNDAVNVKIGEIKRGPTREIESQLLVAESEGQISFIGKNTEIIFQIGPEFSQSYRLVGPKKKEELRPPFDFAVGNFLGIPLKLMPKDRFLRKEDLEKGEIVFLLSTDTILINKFNKIVDFLKNWNAVKIKGKKLNVKKFVFKGENIGSASPFQFIAFTEIEAVNTFNIPIIKLKPFHLPSNHKPKSVDFNFGVPQYKEQEIGIEFVFVKGGSFEIGNTLFTEEENVTVKIVTVQEFYISKHEITQAQWKKIMGMNPSLHVGENLPVENLSWREVKEFINRLNKLTGKNYRLPYEAEWEYAARSGGKQEIWAGTSDKELLSDYAWIDNNSRFKTQPVGLKKANGL